MRRDDYGEAVVTVAGSVAEHRALGTEFVWDDEGGPDVWTDEEELDFLGDFGVLIRLVHDHNVNVEHAVREAQLALDEYWPLVERIVAGLIADGELTGDQITAMIPGEPVSTPGA